MPGTQHINTLFWEPYPRVDLGMSAGHMAQLAGRKRRPHINGCYAVNEPGASTIESSIGVFTEVCTINTTGRPRSWKVLGARLQRSGHRSDDKSVEDAIEKCFGLMRKH